MKEITFKHQPKKGKITHSLSFVKHLFGEEWEKGLDYLSLLYTQPRRALPSLILHGEGPSGKTVFLQWLGILLAPGQMTFWPIELYLTGNTDYYIISSENPRIDWEFYNRIEALRSAKKILGLLPSKFIFTNSTQEVEEPPFLYNTWWCVPTSQIKEVDKLMLFKLKKEIHAFLFFLKNRKVSNF